MKYQTITDLTSANIKMTQTAERIVSLADLAKKDMAILREDLDKRYAGAEFSHISKTARSQMKEVELRKQSRAILTEFEQRTTPLLKEVSGLAETINGAREFYENPVKRLNVETSRNPDHLARRNQFMQLLKDAGPNDLETQFQVAASTNDLPVLAAISSIVNARDDTSLRKLLPSAKVAGAADFGDTDQVNAILHGGRHMVDVVMEHTREVTAIAIGRRGSGIDRVKQGLRGSGVEAA